MVPSLGGIFYIEDYASGNVPFCSGQPPEVVGAVP